MTIEHNENFDLAYRFVTETSENIFLTGKAGTGKTTFLRYLRDYCTKQSIVAAPTGVAAINAGGVTLHSLFQLPFHPFIPTAAGKDSLLKTLRFNRQRQQLLRQAELLIIDEISMVRCDTMDAIDTILRSIRRNYRIPFGGMQILCIGDLHQLAPVAQPREWDLLQEFYPSPFFFDSHAVKEQQPLLIELEKIYRQKEESFVALLNNVRVNSMLPADFNLLHSRFIPGFNAPESDKYITLTSHNSQANLINNSQIQKLPAPAFTYEAEIENEFPENLFPAEASLMLKEGAQVMFIKNDPVQKRFFNGKIGTVHSLEKEKVQVECDGAVIDVSPETWENTRYSLNRADGRLQQEIIGSFTQYPLRLAWAITIHKSQGLTFSKVMIDAASAFSSGQVYVALSRCTGLEGIVLLSKIPAAAIQSNGNVEKGHRALTHNGPLAVRFAGARQIFIQELLHDLFSFDKLSEKASALGGEISAFGEKLNSDAKQWSTGFQDKISALAATGEKFLRQAFSILKENSIIEENAALQERIFAASAHFLPLVDSLKENLKNHPLITEHRDAADAVNEGLTEMLTALHYAEYLLSFSKEPFSVVGFLNRRLGFTRQKITVSCYASSRRSDVTDSPNPELYERLRTWRDGICAQDDIPVFLVATHAALRDICSFLPINKRELLLISGFGKARAEKYGDEITEAVAEYCERNNIERKSATVNNIPAKKKKHTAAAPPKKKAANKTGGPKPDTRALSFSLLQTGKSIDQISAERGLAPGTVVGHLASYAESGELDISPLITAEKISLLLQTRRDHPAASLSDLKLLLPDISFAEIRLIMAAEKFKTAEIPQSV